MLRVRKHETYKGGVYALHLGGVTHHGLNVIQAHLLGLHRLLKELAEGALAVEGPISVKARAGRHVRHIVALGAKDVDHHTLHEVLQAKGLTHGDLLVTARGNGRHGAGAIRLRIPDNRAAELRGLGLGILRDCRLLRSLLLAALEDHIGATLKLHHFN